MMQKERLSILLLCDKANSQASNVRDHIEAIANSKHTVCVLDNRGSLPPFIKLIDFDVVVIHYSLVMCRPEYVSRKALEAIKEFKGLKVCFIQDEYRFINKTIHAMQFLGIHVVFTCVPTSEFEKVYSQAVLPGLRRINVLTGYVPKDLAKLEVPAFEKRPIAVSYRGRAVPLWLGELGQEKSNIATKFSEDAKQFRLKTDLEFREKERLYGKKWVQFLMNSKACLGVESGASVFDFTGEIEKNVDQHLRKDPKTSFKTLQELYFKEQESKIRLNQISPRCFEAASLRTLMILYEGDYSNILVPWRHYVPLKKDHSNMLEVVDTLQNAEKAKEIIRRAYEEIALNPQYGHRAFTNLFDDTLREEIDKRPELVLSSATICLHAKYHFSLKKVRLKSWVYKYIHFFIWGVLAKNCPRPLKTWLKAKLGL